MSLGYDARKRFTGGEYTSECSLAFLSHVINPRTTSLHENYIAVDSVLPSAVDAEPKRVNLLVLM